MRGMKSTVALLVVLVGLGGYIYFYGDTAANPGDIQKLFTGLVSDNIETLTVKNDAGETTALKKQDGKWTMTAPFQTRASDLDASGIANALAGLDVSRVVDEAPTDVKDYGLDTPSIEVAFTSTDGKPSGKLLLGTKTATGGSLYARKDGETRVVLIGEFNSATFNKSTFDLRDKAIVSFDRSKVDGVDVVQPSGTFELVKKDGTWALAKPMVARADGTGADGLVTAVESLQMKSVVAPSATPDELAKYGLDKPSAVVNLHLGADRIDSSRNRRLVGVRAQTVNRVAHDEGRLGRVEDNDRLAAIRTTDLNDRAAGCLRELVDVARVPGPADFDAIEATISA